MLATRSYIEWNLWRLRMQAPMAAFLDLGTRISSIWLARTNEANSILKSMLAVSEKRAELHCESPAVSPIQRESDAVLEKFRAVGGEIQTLHERHTRQELAENNELWSALSELNQRKADSFDELMGLEVQLRKERSARRERIAAQDEPLARELTELQEAYRRQTAAPKMKASEDQLAYLNHSVRRVSNVLHIRLWFEMLFPMIFGALAIALGFRPA
jgi:hypothetical protein